MRNALRNATEPIAVIKIVQGQVAAFADEAHEILGKQEAASRSRLIALDRSRSKLQGLSLQQDELIREALDCISYGLLRAAHVAAWQAFMDFLEEKLESDGLVKVHGVRPAWAKYKSMEEIREEIPEYQIIDVAHAIRLITKNQKKSLHGMLSTRNDCAHPSAFTPDLNEALGYVSGLINRMAELQAKQL